MKVTELMGFNEFQTAEKVCTVVQVYKETKIPLREIVKDVSKLQFIKIQDQVFAKTLFEYLLFNWNEMQEPFLELVFDYIEKGYEPLTALSAASNEILLGGDIG